jgi:hypothetical protein
MKTNYNEEDYMQKKLKQGKYLIVYCMTEKAAHFFYRIERGNDKRTHKGYPELFYFSAIRNKKGAGTVKFMKNCPKTWVILAGAFRRYGNDIMVWGSNRVYNFHLPNKIQLISKVQFNKIIKNKDLSNVDENLIDVKLRRIIEDCSD